MGRVYHTIISNGKPLNTLFDKGAVHNYITEEASKGLPLNKLSKPYTVAIGGESRNIDKVSLIDGELKGNKLFSYALVVENLGVDEQNRKIDMLLGATEMECWNIKIDPKEEKLDLLRFRKESIEYYAFSPLRLPCHASRVTKNELRGAI